jgi:hypothetical protein
MKILILARNKKIGSWVLDGTPVAPLVADPGELKDDLARRLCDNPSAQAFFGILGEDSFDIQVET